ncbi:MAG: AMP-binding protein, partial [Polyangiaceae bacterium]|nr:AMP-binding protein [Polyangiaceae bacterium]
MSNVLSSQKRALLAQWSRGRTGGASSSIPTVAETASAPLSFTQLGMWLTEQVSPGSSANNVCFCAKLVGQLDLDALGNAFRMLSKRHPLLRARIRSSSTGPIQSFPEDNVLELEREFISGDTHDESLFECLEAYAKAEFEISTQICRAKLFIRDAHEAWLGFVVHHIAFDGWSQSVLVEDLVRLYDAERGGVDAPPPRAAPNFASYVAWEAAQLSGERGKELLAYWSEQLRDLPAIATLPTDRARPIEPKLSSLVARSQIGTQVVERFQALATNTNTTSFDYFFSAFGLALSRFNGLERFAVGVPAANRNHPATAHVIGPLLNTLPLVACPDPDVSFAELVRASTQTTREAFARQDAPLEFLLSSIDVARSEGVTPLFQVLFVLQNATGHLSGIPGLQIERLPITFGTSAFDLSVALEPKNDGGMEIVVEYSEALYDRATIQSFLAYFAGLLAFFANHPEQNRVDFDRLRSLQIPLSDPYPLGASFSSRWARLVALQPNALAVRDRGHRYSYKEVHSIARALGKNFRDRGYQKGDPIALLVKRSAATFIAMLAAWYEGLLFVPISVTEPEERRDKMMAGVGATVAIDLTSIDFSQQLDNVTEEIPAFSGPAYVVFTSGTTGAPKAVCIDHASLNYVTNAWREIYGEGPHRVLQVGQMTADVFIGDAVKAMDTGGALIVADEDERLDPKALGDLLEDEEPTLFEGTPGLLLNFFETAH